MHGTKDRTDEPATEGTERTPKRWRPKSTPRPPREKVTAEQLEARLEEWGRSRRESKEQRTEAQIQSTSRRNLLLGAGTIALAALGMTGLSARRADVEQSENAARIFELESQLSQVGSATPVEGAVEADLTTLADAMRADATTVAALQQRFAELYRAAAMAEDQGNGTPSAEMLAIPEHRRTLAGYFTERSEIAEESAYDWTTSEPFDIGSRIDTRYAWYVRHDEGVASEPSASTWEVTSATPALGRIGEGSAGVGEKGAVTWACRDTAKDQVLAWAQADYTLSPPAADGPVADAPSGLFSALKVTVTALGAKHRPGQQEAQA